jgi:hypothetical protein
MCLGRLTSSARCTIDKCSMRFCAPAQWPGFCFARRKLPPGFCQSRHATTRNSNMENRSLRNGWHAMGMWDWIEEQYPAPGSRAGANGFPPLSAADAALLRLIEQGVTAGARTEDDEPSAAQAARETGAAAVARAVKPPYGRDKGWLTQVPEDWAQRISPLLKPGYLAWPSPSDLVSSMSAPASPALLGASTAIDEPSASQAARDAGAATLARAARHPYGRVFRYAAAPSAPAATENMQQSEEARQDAASRLANAVRRPIGPLPAAATPIETEEPYQAEAAREAWQQRLANDAHPTRGRQMGRLTTYPEYVAEKIGQLAQDAILTWALKKAGGRIFRRRPAP